MTVMVINATPLENMNNLPVMVISTGEADTLECRMMTISEMMVTMILISAYLD